MSQAMRQVIDHHFSLSDRAADPYPVLAFDLPPGVARLDVRYTYSDPVSADLFESRPGSVVDVGLAGPDGFRGWSGSARQSFTLAPGWATPGYLPGPLPAGRWEILLGLYKMPERGCDVHVEIEWEIGRLEGWEDSQTEGARWQRLFDRVASSRAGWYAGELHCHSHHSEASGTLDDVLAAARAQGLDFVAITEHNTVSHLVELAGRAAPPEPLVVPAMEITTYRGHANAFGIRRWHDFRRRNSGEMAALRDELGRAGALFSINHPKVTGPPWELGDEGEAGAIEVWQQPWPVFNYQSLGLWDGLLKQGCRLAAVGGSDKHQGPFDGTAGYHEIGQPATWVYADELSVPALLAGLRAGRTAISAGPRGPHLELTATAGGPWAMIGDTLALREGETALVRCRVLGAAGHLLRLVSAAGRREAAIDADEFEIEWPGAAGDGYWRAEVVEPPPPHQRDEPAAQMVAALSSAIYVEQE